MTLDGRKLPVDIPALTPISTSNQLQTYVVAFCDSFLRPGGLSFQASLRKVDNWMPTSP